VIIVNFKRYLDEIGAERLAGICRRISQECKLEVVVAVEAEHLEKCLQTGVECWTQKFEPMANGYKGSLINHSDFRLGWEVVKDQVVELGNRGKRVCVCAQRRRCSATTRDPVRGRGLGGWRVGSLTRWGAWGWSRAPPLRCEDRATDLFDHLRADRVADCFQCGASPGPDTSSHVAGNPIN
jgi:hypothetical protein